MKIYRIEEYYEDNPPDYFFRLKDAKQAEDERMSLLGYEPLSQWADSKKGHFSQRTYGNNQGIQLLRMVTYHKVRGPK